MWRQIIFSRVAWSLSEEKSKCFPCHKYVGLDVQKGLDINNTNLVKTNFKKKMWHNICIWIFLMGECIWVGVYHVTMGGHCWQWNKMANHCKVKYCSQYIEKFTHNVKVKLIKRFVYILAGASAGWKVGSGVWRWGIWGCFFAQTQISDSDSDLWAWSSRGPCGSAAYVWCLTCIQTF